MRHPSERGTTSYSRIVLFTSVALATCAVPPESCLSDSSATFDVDPNSVEGEVEELEAHFRETSSHAASEILEGLELGGLEKEDFEALMDRAGDKWIQGFEQTSTRLDEKPEQTLWKLELMRKFEEQRERVELLDGRHHPEGDVATDDAIEEALYLIDKLYAFQIVPEAVNATADSHVLFEFADGALYDSVELLGDGTLIHTFMQQEEGVHAQKVSLEDGTVIENMSKRLANVYNPK